MLTVCNGMIGYKKTLTEVHGQEVPHHRVQFTCDHLPRVTGLSLLWIYLSMLYIFYSITLSRVFRPKHNCAKRELKAVIEILVIDLCSSVPAIYIRPFLSHQPATALLDAKVPKSA